MVCGSTSVLGTVHSRTTFPGSEDDGRRGGGDGVMTFFSGRVYRLNSTVGHEPSASPNGNRPPIADTSRDDEAIKLEQYLHNTRSILLRTAVKSY